MNEEYGNVGMNKQRQESKNQAYKVEILGCNDEIINVWIKDWNIRTLGW